MHTQKCLHMHARKCTDRRTYKVVAEKFYGMDFALSRSSKRKEETEQETRDKVEENRRKKKFL